MRKLLIKLVAVVTGALLLAVASGALVKHEMTRPVGVEDESLISQLAPGALWLADLPKNLYLSLTDPFAFNLVVPDRFAGNAGFEGDPNTEEYYLLLSRADGDTGIGIVELIDLRTFEVKHTWRPDLHGLVDEWNAKVAELYDDPQYIDPFELVYHPMMIGGDLVFNAVHSTMRKVDACSQPVWQITPAPNEWFHHSIDVDVNGNIWSLGSNANRTHPWVADSSASRHYRDDSIVKLNSDGEVLFTKSISDILTENGLGYLMWGTQFNAYHVDWLHTNDVQPAYSDTKYWKKGDVLISLHTPSLVLLYRPSTNELIWHSVGFVHAQHDADFVDDSRISIFDNDKRFHVRKPEQLSDRRVIDESVWSEGHNQVIVYDFATEKYSSYLNASLQEHKLQTYGQGRSEILPNGDLFIEETAYGRTLYFNADGSLRWSHVNRANDGNVYVVAWSRVLYRDHEIEMVRDFLENKDERLAACRKP